MTDDEIDETARLILMESPHCSLMEFARALRENCGPLGLVEIGAAWRRYRWFDGGPTHDVVTGERIVR